MRIFNFSRHKILEFGIILTRFPYSPSNFERKMKRLFLIPLTFLCIPPFILADVFLARFASRKSLRTVSLLRALSLHACAYETVASISTTTKLQLLLRGETVKTWGGKKALSNRKYLKFKSQVHWFIDWFEVIVCGSSAPSISPWEN